MTNWHDAICEADLYPADDDDSYDDARCPECGAGCDEHHTMDCSQPEEEE